jgi:hypothetical protein
VRAIAILALLLGALGGCTLFDDPPDRSCRTDMDCFRAQGERCNDDNQCEVPPDAAPPLEEAEDEELEAASEEVADE